MAKNIDHLDAFAVVVGPILRTLMRKASVTIALATTLTIDKLRQIISRVQTMLEYPVRSVCQSA